MTILNMTPEGALERATDYVTAVVGCHTKAEMKVCHVKYSDCASTAVGLRAVSLVVITNQARCDAITEDVPKQRLAKLKLLNDFMVEQAHLSESTAYQALAKASKLYHADLADYNVMAAFIPLYYKAMADNNAVALKVLAHCYLGLANNYDSAIMCFEQAALLGDVPLYENFACYFFTATDVPKRIREVMLYLTTKLAEDSSADPNIWLYLSCCYLSSYLSNPSQASAAFEGYLLALKVSGVGEDESSRSRAFVEGKLAEIAKDQSDVIVDVVT